MSTDESAPAVVAVVVTHNPGSYFDDLLRSLEDQDYPNLSVLIVDAASENELDSRVTEIFPDAFVRHLTKNPGYSAAANEALTAVEGAALLLFCHDDVVLETSALRFMVEEVYKSNAGIVSPKMVELNNPDQLITIGASADKVGMVLRTVEVGEIDQGQHDSVREVFVAPGGCMLIRADLFKVLGGFDPEMRFTFEDVDLSWRAQIVGARVIATPAARVRHGLKGSRGQRSLPFIGKRPGSRAFRNRLREMRAENSLRCVLKNYSFLHLLRVLPQMIAIGILESIYGIVTGRPALALTFLRSWTTNLRNIRSLFRARRQVQSSRQVSDSIIRKQQVSVRQRIATYWRSQFAYEREAKGKNQLRAAAGPGAFRDTPRLAAVLWIGLTVLTAFAARILLFGSIPEVGLLRGLRGSGFNLFRDFLEPGRIGELASKTLPNNPVVALMGIVASVMPSAHVSLPRSLVFGAYALGLIFMYRTMRMAGAHGQVLATALYALSPAFLVSLSRGSVSGLTLFAVTPLLVRYIATIFGIDPFAAGWNNSLALRASLVIALGGLFAPEVFLVAALLGIVAIVVQLFGARPDTLSRGVVRFFWITLVAFALTLPFGASLFSDNSWASWLPQASFAHVSFSALMRSDVRPIHTGIFGWGIPVGAGLVLLIGREWRFRLSSFFWCSVLGLWWIFVAGQHDWLGGLHISEPVIVSVATALLCLCIGLGVTAFFADLPQFKFGFRQLASVFAAACVALSVLPYLGNSLSGRWRLPSSETPLLTQPTYSELSWLNDLGPTNREFRVLWIGNSDLLPVRGWTVNDDLRAGLSRDGLPSIDSAFVGSPSNGAKKNVIGLVRNVSESNGVDAASKLSSLRVRYVVIPRGAPGSVDALTATVFTKAFDQQLEFRRVDSSTTAYIFENAKFAPSTKHIPRSSVPAWIYASLILDALLWFGVLWTMRRLTPDVVTEEWQL